MKEKALVRLLLLLMMQQLSLIATAQNVGIGTNAPTGPLSFANTLGNKLVLWGNGNNAHYGIGVQSTYLQLYADVANSNIAFGYGRSGSFTERARIFNSGLEGMYLNGRLHLRNGDATNAGGGGGIWLYKPDNTAAIGFMGTQNDRNIGFYGGPTQWGFTYDITNGRVGIGNNLPNAPLAFAATLGKKITLYPGTLGDAGFCMAGNRLQIYSDNPNADVAIGYDAAGTFNERFSVKPTGALALTGNQGANGEVVTSGGAGPAYYSRPGYYYQAKQSGFSVSANENGPSVDVPGLTAAINLATPARVVFHLSGNYSGNYCLACENPSATMLLYRNIVGGTELVRSAYSGGLGYAWRSGVLASGPIVVDYPAGSYTFKVMFNNSGYTDVLSLSNAFLTWQIFPN